jgi:hypothetical protein
MLGGVGRGVGISEYGRSIQHSFECVEKAVNKSITALLFAMVPNSSRNSWESWFIF